MTRYFFTSKNSWEFIFKLFLQKEAEERAAAALAATRTVSAVESNMRDILNRGISNNWR